MLFTSYSFLLFLILLFVIYYVFPSKAQWVILLIASLIFYALNSPVYLIFIGITILTTYGAGILLDNSFVKEKAYIKEHKATLSKEEKKAYKRANKTKRRWLFWSCLVFNFGILAVTKYTNFGISNINGIMKMFHSGTELQFVDLIIPLGISFYTFQSMGYLIDVSRDSVKAQRNIGKLALFVIFFPQLVQGPISRYGDLSTSLYEAHPFDINNFMRGIERIIWGFFKKLVIADRILPAVNTLKDSYETMDGFYVVLLGLFYALELYADFTGGIDITIGIAEALGIKVKENFIRPYFSKCIKEYWRRWHISLGAYFTEYLFYPVSVCKPMLDISKVARKILGEKIGKKVPVYLSTIIVWLITGIWHGAAWNFVVWGLGNCFFIMLSEELDPVYIWVKKKLKINESKYYYRAFQIIRTFILMCSLRMFDLYRNVPVTFKMLGTTLYKWNVKEVFTTGIWNLGINPADYIILIFGTIILFTVSMMSRRENMRDIIAKKGYVLRGVVYGVLFISIIVFGAYGMGYDASQFIYNQF